MGIKGSDHMIVLGWSGRLKKKRVNFNHRFALYTKKQYRFMVMDTVISTCPQGCARSRTKRPINLFVSDTFDHIHQGPVVQN